ncbi:sensor histidine kinase [Polyangium jinanense]|uniref:histidine kinase n=1 Tax=Polyangium jinanense TaxID=2829994 RepID=A0A9X4AX55_9BACT|nr:MASE1 domain-containing protein [Polyangium jinanense]MDC3958888.1 MASE1 domain-containing protein [Polyangium jinanense]MDC3986002.1 MASE1 domain-containing protein [Polyangium jinanense]
MGTFSADYESGVLAGGLRRWLMSVQPARTVLACVVLFLAHLGLSEASYLFVFPPANNAVFWLPSGLTMAWFLRTTPAQWSAWLFVIFLAEVLVVLLHGQPPGLAIAWGAAAGLLPFTGASFLRRQAHPVFVFRRPWDVVRLVFLGAVVGALPGTLVAAAASVAWLGEHSFWKVAVAWWSSDALGVILLCPLFLTWTEPEPSRSGRAAEALSLLVILTVGAYWVFASVRPREIESALPALLFPLTAWAAIRFGPRGATAATVIVDFMATLHTSQGRGPFAMSSASVAARVLTVQTYVAVLNLLILLLAMVVVEEQKARAAAERAQQRMKFLATASEILSESLDFSTRFAALARLCVQSMADWCVIDVGEGGVIRRLGGAHRDPSNEALLRELEEHYAADASSPQPAGRVLRTGKPVLLPLVTDEVLKAHAIDDEHARLIRALGTRSAMAVPLSVRGQTIGVLSLGCATLGRQYSPADLELATELARRAAISIDNARLYRDAQAAVRLRDEILSIASHELNTPIASLQLDVQTLKRGSAQSGDPLPPSLTRVERQVKKLARLIQELLDVTRITTGRLHLQIEDVDLPAVVRDVTERFTEDLSRAACPLTLHAEPAMVGRWDHIRLEQVVTNLVSNAIKFGSGRPIEIWVGEADGMARLTVRDHGIGIPPDRLPYIFERFERAVSSRAYAGLGLGLYIVRSIVEALGGSIRVESTLGSGTMFTVELPRAGPPRSAGKEGEN